MHGSVYGCLSPRTSCSCQQCQASFALHVSGAGETGVAANPRDKSSPSSLARLSHAETTEMQSGLFAFWIMLIDQHITILGCVVDMHKSKSMLFLVWGVFFSFGIIAPFGFLLFV